MKTEFQIKSGRLLTEFAHRNHLEAYPILDSGNGTEYKNYLSKTVFTVYHDRLDKKNQAFIELAIGVDNIAAELNIESLIVKTWLSRIKSEYHPAKSKWPHWWERLSLWSIDEVENFCDTFEDFLNSATTSPSAGYKDISQATVPPIDERVMREILTRRGQTEFRSSLLVAYGRRCAISGCTDVEVLEAVHITPHSETQDYRPSNGILLRSDLHTLFDLRLVSIDPQTALVCISRRLSSIYQSFHGL